MSVLKEPLWSNTRIIRATDGINYQEFNGQGWLEHNPSMQLMRRIRDEYEARIAELEAQLARMEDWTPPNVVAFFPGKPRPQATEREE